jgi:hypothetical protein
VIKKRTTNTAGEPYRDGRPRYEARVRGPDGNLALRTFTTMKAAQAWERDKFAEKDHGSWVAQSGGRVKLADFANEWIEGAVDLAPSTLRIYRDNLRLHILAVLGDLQLGAITPELCDRWLAGLRRKVSRRDRWRPPRSTRHTGR